MNLPLPWRIMFWKQEEKQESDNMVTRNKLAVVRDDVGEVLVHMQGITKYYGKNRVLTGINLQIAKGDILGIIGPNGSGKSTLIKILLGLVYPTRGKIHFPLAGGLKLRALPDRPGFFPGFSLKRNLAIFSMDADRTLVTDTAGRMGVFSWLDQKFRQCSTGIQKRCELVAALVHKPDLLVLDEPISGMDPGGIAELREIVRELRAKGSAVVITDHALDEMERICTKICFIQRGIIRAIESRDQLQLQFGNLEEAYRFYNLRFN